MTIKSQSLIAIIITILNSFVVFFPRPILSQQPAQLVANYIAVEEIEGSGILRGEVVGKPTVDDKVVTGTIRVHNKTKHWIGLSIVNHNANITPQEDFKNIYSKGWGIIPPDNYLDYTVNFYLEDDFVTFVFDNRHTPA